MDETDINERIRAMAADGEIQPTVNERGFTDYLSGAFQNALSLGQTYLTRRMDIELQSALAGAQAKVERPSNQRQVTDHALVTPQYGIGGSSGSWMPLAIGAGALLIALLMVRKG